MSIAWLKVLHLFFIVAWFAGLLYLPRLFVYHAEARDQVGRDRFCTMEKRLSIMMSIGAVGTILFGIWLLISYGGPWLANNGWMHAKLLLVLLLVLFHGWCQMQVKKFRKGKPTCSARTYRFMNEAPTIGLLLILILVFVRPF